VTPWYEETFGRDYLALYPHRGLDEARADIAAIVSLLEPPKDQPLLDLCCGAGRHLMALHEAGFSDLTGIDLSRPLLDVARCRLDEAGGFGVALLVSDMREIPFRARFTAVLSLFTSFGYFPRPAQDAAVLCAAFAALRPEGTLLMDTLNRPATIRSLVSRTETTLGRARVVIHRRLSSGRHRIEKRTRIVPPDGQEKVYRESVRLYSREELGGMLVRAGFVDPHFFGGLDGRPYGPDPPRMVAIARRPT